MYLTQNAQILAEHKPWNHENESHHHHEKNFVKKWPGMDEKISDQVNHMRVINFIYKCTDLISLFFSSHFQIQHLCAQFVKDRLRREGLLTRNVSILIEVHPAKAFPIRNILMVFNRMALELEKMHPRTFSNLAVVSEHEAPVLIENIGRALFRQGEITWGKIISWFSLTSAFVIDCVKSGQPDMVQAVIDVACIVMKEEGAGLWIEGQGKIIKNSLIKWLINFKC